MKLITWNVNSIRIRLELLHRLVEMEAPDIVCVQEVKAKKEDFPFEEIKALGFEHIALYSMPGYNGVAILSKLPLSNIEALDWVSKTDARHIKATILDDIELHNIYIPAGGDIPDALINLSFAHKLTFIDDIAECWENTCKNSSKKMIVCGDLNIAPLEHDVWDHKKMSKIISHTPVEIERLTRLQESADFVDLMRECYPEPQKLYTWWGYRNVNFLDNNKGRRLDHIWATPNIAPRFKNCKILTEARVWDRPSDHVPVVIEFD